MLFGTVVGNVWCTKKSPALTGQAFLLVESAGETLVCADGVGAGPGDQVLVVRGSAARTALGEHIPVDAAIVGIADQLDPPSGQIYQ